MINKGTYEDFRRMFLTYGQFRDTLISENLYNAYSFVMAHPELLVRPEYLDDGLSELWHKAVKRGHGDLAGKVERNVFKVAQAKAAEEAKQAVSDN